MGLAQQPPALTSPQHNLGVSLPYPLPQKLTFLGHLGDSWAAHVVPVPPSPYANVASAMIPDGGLHCNLNSWQRYLAAHLAEDEDFLPKDMWTYIHTPITQDFYGFGWMIDNSNDETGDISLFSVVRL